MTYEFFIGIRYLKAKRKQAFISLITMLSTAGVALGVMALVVVIAVMTGFESDLKDRILGIESHIIIMRYSEPISSYPQVIAKIESVSGVSSVAPFIYSQVMLRSASKVAGAVLRGIDPAKTVQSESSISMDCLKLLVKKDSAKAGSLPGIILGKALADKLKVVPKDIIFLTSARPARDKSSLVPTIKQFQVKGLMETGMHEYDVSMAFILLGDAQKLFHMENQISGLAVKINDIYQAPQISGKILKQLDYPYWARDWIQMNRNLFAMLKLQKTVMFIIMTLIILVAAFNIASALIMMVMEKTRDISILKAMGATSKSIKKIFVFKGLIIGSAGTIIGLGAGFILCLLLKKYQFINLPGDVYFLNTLPVKLEGIDTLVIVLASLLICFLATLYPAGQASKLNPVDGIRYG